jgi:hypothetical protein
LLDKLLFKCGTRAGHKVIKNLLIVGHGNRTGMYIGDWVDENTLPVFNSDLMEMAFLFSRDGDACVRLGGCEVGQAVRLMALLSNSWGGVLVRGMSWYQLGP